MKLPWILCALPALCACAATPPPPARVAAPARPHDPLEAPARPAREERAAGKRTSGEQDNHLGLGVGVSAERDGEGARWGLDYERHWDPEWGLFDRRFGVGAMVEWDAKPVDTFLVAALAFYHPLPPLALMLGPGYGFRPEEPDTFLLRVGMKYEFELGERVSLGPELYYDFLEGGERGSVLSLNLGYGF